MRSAILFAALWLADGLRMPAQTSPVIGGCAVFPADNFWNVPIDTLPVDRNSAAIIEETGPLAHLHPDFGPGATAGIPYVVIPGTQSRVPVVFRSPQESDPGPYPVPPDAPVEGGPRSRGDRHVLVLDRDRCLLYELYAAYPQPDGSWQAGSGAIFDLKAHALRPVGWTSADAAGLPILPGLVRYEEVGAGEIRHAIRLTVPRTRGSYIWPARHRASRLVGNQYPPMGQRFRLKADYDISDFPQQARVILRALKKYGMIIADNGSAWFLTGAPHPNWDNEQLAKLKRVLGRDLEAVDASSLMQDPNSGRVRAASTLR